MGRPKKEKGLEVRALDPLDVEEQHLKDKLSKVQVCNKLIRSENPFSIEFPDKKFLKTLIKEFHGFIRDRILSDIPVEAVSNEEFPFTPEEMMILKMLAQRAANNTVSPKKGKKEEKVEPQNLVIDFAEGNKVRTKSKAIFKTKEEGPVMLSAGVELFFVKMQDADVMVVLDDDGREGHLSRNKVERAF